MTPDIMRQHLAAHAPEREVVELPEERKRFEEVVTPGGATRATIPIPPARSAQLTGAPWVDVCNDIRGGNGQWTPTTIQGHF